MSNPQVSGPPYPPQTAAVGGVPTVGVDVPIAAVFMLLYMGAAAGHMSLLQLNLRRQHKFVFSGLMFGFCMARIVTMIMRIVWAVYPTNIRVAIAAQIFVNAGVLILFIVNMVFAQRILRAAHPTVGWHKGMKIGFTVVYVIIGLMLAMLITAIVQQFYTLSTSIHRIDRDMQMAGTSYFLAFCFAPIPLVLLTIAIPRKGQLEKFGHGSWRVKVLSLLFSATLLTLGAAFRATTLYKNPLPRTQPAWYDAKWCFYFFNFVLEIIVIYFYLAIRVDLRFHVPNGSKGPGDYSRGRAVQEKNTVQEAGTESITEVGSMDSPRPLTKEGEEV